MVHSSSSGTATVSLTGQIAYLGEPAAIRDSQTKKHHHRSSRSHRASAITNATAGAATTTSAINAEINNKVKELSQSEILLRKEVAKILRDIR
jgi:hypothetical protein